METTLLEKETYTYNDIETSLTTTDITTTTSTPTIGDSDIQSQIYDGVVCTNQLLAFIILLILAICLYKFYCGLFDKC